MVSMVPEWVCPLDTHMQLVLGATQNLHNVRNCGMACGGHWYFVCLRDSDAANFIERASREPPVAIEGSVFELGSPRMVNGDLNMHMPHIQKSTCAEVTPSRRRHLDLLRWAVRFEIFKPVSPRSPAFEPPLNTHLCCMANCMANCMGQSTALLGIKCEPHRFGTGSRGARRLAGRPGVATRSRAGAIDHDHSCLRRRSVCQHGQRIHMLHC